jgi:hypothetical protein
MSLIKGLIKPHMNTHGKRYAVHDLIFDLRFDLQDRAKASLRESLCIASLAEVLQIVTKNTMYNEDVDELMNLCRKHIPRYFDSEEVAKVKSE